MGHLLITYNAGCAEPGDSVKVRGAGHGIYRMEVARVTERSLCLRRVPRTCAAGHESVRGVAMSETNLKRAGNTFAVKPVQLRSLTSSWRARERGSVQE